MTVTPAQFWLIALIALVCFIEAVIQGVAARRWRAEARELAWRYGQLQAAYDALRVLHENTIFDALGGKDGHQA